MGERATAGRIGGSARRQRRPSLALALMLLSAGPALAHQSGDEHAHPAMPKDEIGYPRRVAEALRTVVRDVLAETARRGGLLGDHHFFITFDAGAEGVRLSDEVRAKHPAEMTVVLQYQFADLVVSDSAIEVDLWFSGRRERVRIPFVAMTAFHDPSVNFSAKLRVDDQADARPSR